MNKKTIVIISRGARVANLFKETALDLTKDYHVIALVDESEYEFWSDAKDIEVINFDKAFNDEADKVKGDLYNIASKIEVELGLSVFKSASNYLLYRKFVRQNNVKWRKWYIDDFNVMLRNYVGSYQVLSRIIRENQPALIFFENPDLISCRIATALGFLHGIFALGIRFSPYTWDDKQRMWFAYGFESRNVLLEHYYKNKGLIKSESYANGREIIRRINNQEQKPITIRACKKDAERFLDWKSFIWWAMVRMGHGILTLQPRRYLKMCFNILWINKNFHYDIPKEPYIAFFMHYQPEATTSCQVPRWVNQDIVLEQLATNGPLGLKILIKEHTKNFGARGKQYFGELIEMFNVHLCHPVVNTHSIISNAQAILTLTGTVGFEAIAMGKKVATLGKPYYHVYEGVKRLNYPEEIFGVLRDPSWRPEEMKEDRETFVSAYAQSVYELGFGGPRSIWPKTGGDKLASGIKDFINKKDEYKLMPRMFGRGY